jgi:hypothetical protein
MDAHHALYLDLELVCRGTRSSWYRQRPPGPSREIFGAPLGYLELFTRQSTAGPREVPELEVWERPPATLRNALTADPREVLELEVQKLVLAAGPTAATIKVEDVDDGPRGGCCRHVRQRPPPKLKTSMAGPLRGAAGMPGSDHHRSWRRRWRASWRVLAAGPIAVTIEVRDVDG